MTLMGGAAETGGTKARARPSSPPMIVVLKFVFLSLVLNLQIPTLAKEWLDELVRFVAVAEAPLVAIPHELSRDAQRDGAQRQPLYVFRRDRKIGHAGRATFAGADPILLVVH